MSMSFVDPRLRQISTERLDNLSKQTEELLVKQPRTQESASAYNPLTGNETAAPDVGTKVERLLEMIARLTNDVMLAQAFQVPNHILSLEFDGPIPTVGYREIFFAIQGKHVSATTLYLQNSSPSPIWFDFNGIPAGPNSILLSAGSSASPYSMMMSSLTLYAGATIPINQQGGLIVRAFGSSELTRQRGQR